MMGEEEAALLRICGKGWRECAMVRREGCARRRWMDCSKGCARWLSIELVVSKSELFCFLARTIARRLLRKLSVVERRVAKL
jgi:hypothetical protein